MRPRFIGRLGLADWVTIFNAVLGFVAIVVAFEDIHLAARLVLLAAILDGLDGVIARKRGGTPVGPYLDSLADVASFSIAPAVLAYVVIVDAWGLGSDPVTTDHVLVLAVCGLFVAMAIARLGLYTAYDTAETYTEGVQTTLAATIFGAAILAREAEPTLVLGGLLVFSALMVAPIRYPDLLARDAFIMGAVHGLAILIPDFAGRTFPYALLFLGLAYLTLAPLIYWRSSRFAGDLYGNA